MRKPPTDHHLIAILSVFLLALCATGIANAQAWDTNVLTATPPTTCTTGEPVSACPVTGYRFERSATPTGTFTRVIEQTGAVYTHTGVTAGQNCYRVIATSANGDSLPSAVVCKTNTRPVGPPSAPGLTVTAPTAFNVRADYQKFAFVKSTRWGSARLGAACDESRTTGDGYYVVSRLNMVTPRPPAGTVIVAKCG